MAQGAAKNYQIDMCQGPLFKQIIVFAVPFIFSGLLQILFHSADLLVLGRFSSYRALAAVGATGSLTMLIINVFLGISVGTNVMLARYIGEKNRKEASRTVHTSIYISLVGGVVIGIFGMIMAKTFLRWMDTPDDVIDMASLYMRIYFAGMPIVMVYNFGSAVMRAAGDTRRPFYFLIIGGIINVILNLFFVLVCGMDVGGVALATVISQGVSAFMILRVMEQMTDGCRLVWKKLKIHWKNLREMMWIGVPTGFQGSCFSIANIMVQSSINLFGAEVMAGNTAATQWEGFLFVTSTAMGMCVCSFVSQNLGGKQYKRIRQSIIYCMIVSVCSSLFISALIFCMRNGALSLFNKDPDVIEFGVQRFAIMLTTHWICAIMEISISSLRGLGYSIVPTLIMIFGICIFRILWLMTVFKKSQTINNLLLTYPLSWLLVAVIGSIYLYYALKKYPDKNMPRA